MEKLDFNSWPRKEIFNFFSLSNPFYLVTFRHDVTKIYDFAKENNISFYYSMIYLCTKAINSVDAFLYEMRDDGLYRLSERVPSFTDIRKGEDQFYIVTTPMKDNIIDYCKFAKESSLNQKEFIDFSSESNDLIYFSSLPWLDITAISNERDLSSDKSKNDAIPHITWGKYSDNHGHKELGISIEVNHKYIDGLHIGQFASALTELSNNL